jgi:hypothetical protein
MALIQNNAQLTSDPELLRHQRLAHIPVVVISGAVDLGRKLLSLLWLLPGYGTRVRWLVTQPLMSMGVPKGMFTEDRVS